MDHQTCDWSQVSGFYGPGAWAGYILASATTLYSIHRGPSKRTVQLAFIPVLYVHMAAIDLLKRIKLEEELSEQSLAAVVVVAWGLWSQAYVYVDTIVHAHFNPEGPKAMRQRLQTMTTLCSIIPAVAITTFFICLWEDMFAPAIGDKCEENWFNRQFLQHGAKGYVAILAGFFLENIIRGHRSAFNASDGTLRMCWQSTCTATWQLLIGFAGLSLVYSEAAVITLRFILEDSCISQTAFPLKPIAPQGIGEMDQIFSLLSGIGLVLCEVVPDSLRMMKPWTSSVSRNFLEQRAL